MISPSDFREIVSGKREGLASYLARVALRAIESPYTWAVQYRNRGYDRGTRDTYQVNVPVISIGNLTLGGTGKTPCVAWMARWFRDCGIRVAIISRGYRAQDGQPNDEALELEQRLPDVPHLQNADRVQAANIAIEELDTELILLDDGFQHRRLGRDLDIVLIDALEPFGFEHVFPRGTLREPLANLKRADIVCLSRSDMVTPSQRQPILDRIGKLNSDACICLLAHTPHHLLTASHQIRGLEHLTNASVAAFCGIGNPEAFRQTVQSCDATVTAWKVYPDHHEFTREDVQRLISWAESTDVDMALCTQKDLVKLGVERLGTVPLYALNIEMEVVEGLANLEQRLQAIVDILCR